MFELIAEVGLRLGAVRAIDLPDFDAGEMVIRLRHRPEGTEEYGTPLNNGRDGARTVNVSDKLCGFLEDYVEHTRVETKDRYGREPLFTTTAVGRRGRPSAGTSTR
jgi:integrase